MKKGGPKRDEGKERQWREVIVRQAESGLSVRAFCLEAGIKESAFYFWRRKLKKRGSAKRPVQVDRAASEVEEKADAADRGMFVPVVAESMNEQTDATVEMILPSGAVVRWSGGEVDAVAEWVAKLEARLC